MNILQIGCNNCDDHVAKYVSSNVDKIDHLILIDIDKSFVTYANRIYKNVKQLTTIVTAITSDSTQKEITLYHLKHHMFSGHTSFSYDHMRVHGHSPDNIVKVVHPARTITSILEEYNITNLERLYIDTEGLDVDILMTIDYNKYNVSHITFEHIHCDGAWKGNSTNPKLVQFLNYMNMNGYTNRPSATDSLNTDLIKRT